MGLTLTGSVVSGPATTNRYYRVFDAKFHGRSIKLWMLFALVRHSNIHTGLHFTVL